MKAERYLAERQNDPPVSLRSGAARGDMDRAAPNRRAPSLAGMNYSPGT